MCPDHQSYIIGQVNLNIGRVGLSYRASGAMQGQRETLLGT